MADKKETFTRARERLLEECRANGWTVKVQQSNGKPLKEPWAEKLDARGRKMRLVFKSQAVYDGTHSIVSDIRGESLHSIVKAGFGLAAAGLGPEKEEAC